MMTNILIWALMALFIFWFFGGFKYISKVKKRKRVQARLKDQSIGTQLKQLTDALENTNLRQIHGLLSQANYHQLSLMEPLCAKYVTQLTEYIKQYPDQENGLYLLGVAETDIAWQLRSGAISTKLSDNQVNDFMQYLGRAETIFSRAMELKPDQPHIYPMMLRVMKGLGKKSGSLSPIRAGH